MAENVLEPPEDQLFYRVIATTMSLISYHGQYWSWYKMPNNFMFHVHRYLMYAVVPLTTGSQVIYLVIKYNELELDTLLMVYTALPVAFMVLLKLCIAQTRSYEIAMRKFMAKIHLHSYYEKNKESYVRQALTTAEKMSRWTYYYYVGLCFICCAAFEVIPVVHNLQNNASIDNITNRLEIIIHLWLPFDYEFNFHNWIIVQICMFYVGFTAMAFISFFDCINMTFLYHVIGHIKILKHKIEYFHKNGTQEEIKHDLIEISCYHIFLSKTINDVEAAFGLNVAGIYLHNLFGGSLFIFQIMTSETDTETIFTYGLMIPIYMGILAIMSLALEDVRIKGDEIPDLIYGLNWEKMSLPNQKLVLMILLQVQSGLEFKAAFNIKTGVEPAISIFKTAFSFYVMIKSRI